MAIRENLIQARSLYVGVSPNVAPASSNLGVDGSVGIGTPTPNERLHIVGNTGTRIRISSSDNYHIGNLGWEDTRVFLSAAGYGSPALGFDTAGSERMRITNGGNVGIGTTNPTNRLQVTGTAGLNNAITSFDSSTFVRIYADANVGSSVNWVTGTALRFATSDNNFGSFTERMRITEAGELAVGTSSPLLYNSGRGNITINGSTQSILTLGVAGTWKTYLYTDGGRTDLSAEGYLAFGTAGGYEKMRITTGGNIGIGTTNPAAKLEVAGSGIFSNSITTYSANSFIISSGPYNAVFHNSSTSTSDYNSIRITQGSAGSATGYFGTGGSTAGNPSFQNTFVVGTQTSNAFVLNTNDTERMRITSSGNVGIGTTNPSAKLHISNGNDSFTLYGPNASWGAYLWVGAGTDKISNGSAQVISTNGNLHLDSGTGQETYINYYSQTSTLINPQGGNVAVGTFDVNSFPYAAKFNVNGSISSSGGKIGFGVTDAFTVYGYSAAHYGFSYSLGSANPLALSGYYGIGFFSQGSEIMRVTGDGYIAIGTTYTYGNKLTVNGGISGTPSWNNATLELRSDSGLTTALAFHRAGYTVSTIYSDNGSIVFGESGGERMRISGGNVGIGTSNPVSKAQVTFQSDFDGLRIENSVRGHNYLLTTSGTSAEFFSIYDVDNSQYLYQLGNTGHGFLTGGVTRMVINSSGNVGIGTTSPSSILNVVATGIAQAALTVQDNARKIKIGRDQIEATDLNDTAATMYLQPNANLAINTSAGNTGIGTTSPTSKLSITDGATMYANQTGALIDVKVNASNGNDTTSRSGIRLGNNSNAFSIFYGGTTDRLRFVDGGNIEVLTLVNGGNVGIGTTSPAAKLEVYGSGFTSSSVNFLARNGVGTKIIESFDNGFIRLNNLLNTNQAIYINNGNSNYHYALDSHIFNVVDDSFQRIDFVTIKGNAAKPKMGIGTMNPTETLSVVGTVESLPTSSSEGGQVTLRAATGYSYKWNVDNYQDNFRIFREDDSTGGGGYVAFFMNQVGTAGFNTTSPARSAILDLTARDRGFLPPRMTNTEMNAINTPAEGLIVYDTTNKKVTVFNGSSWVPLH